jgi:hypothetical protein
MGTAVFLSTGSILVLLGLVMWRVTGCIGSRAKRQRTRAIVRALFIPGAWLIFATMGRAFGEGKYVCLHCGLRAERVTFLDATLHSNPMGDEARATGRPVRSYAELVGGDGEHAWFPLGCISTFGGVSCSAVARGVWFDELPNYEDERTARALADTFRSLAPREQHELLSACDFAVLDTPDRTAAFCAWLDRWRAEHPGWP